MIELFLEMAELLTTRPHPSNGLKSSLYDGWAEVCADTPVMGCLDYN